MNYKSRDRKEYPFKIRILPGKLKSSDLESDIIEYATVDMWKEGDSWIIHYLAHWIDETGMEWEAAFNSWEIELLSI
jgi:hypothetical protein